MLCVILVSLIGGAITQRGDGELQQIDAAEKRVVCYYTNWSVYRKGLAKYEPQNINPYLCTHLVYAFGGLTDEFEVAAFDSYQDIDQGGYAKFNGMKQYNRGLKTLLAIGGWNEGSGRFSEMVSVPEFRTNFTASVIKHLRRYQFDGLDLDWEYPGSREGSVPEDKENYAILVKEIREAFEEESVRVSKERLLLTMAVPAGQTYIDKGYDIPTLDRYLDFFNLLTYDYHSVYEPTVNHHSALLPPIGTSEYEWDAQLNVDWTVKYYIKKGASKSKIVIGTPTYGRSYTLLDGGFNKFGSSADGPGAKGKYTNEKGYLAFYEICELISVEGWEVRKPYPKRIGPIAFKGNQWVGYDDEKIAARKSEYVRDNELGGIMFWTLDSDDFRGICNGKQYPLIEAAKKALFQRSDNSTVSEPRSLSPETSEASQGRNTIDLNEKRNKLSSQSLSSGQIRTDTRGRRPGGQSRRSRPTTTTTLHPLNTPKPPTTPTSIQAFACRREGFYPNPDDCRKYYRCLDSGNSGLGIVAHPFSCPSDLVFNKKIDGCDHPDRTKCKTNTNRGGANLGTTTPIPTTTEFDYKLSKDYLDNYDDYYYYYYDEEPSPADGGEKQVKGTHSERDPNAPIRNSGGSQFEGTKVIANAEEVQRPRPQYTTIDRERTNVEQQQPVEDERSPVRPNRIEYTTLNREKPQLPAEVQEEEDIPPEEESATYRDGLNYATLSRFSPEIPSEELAPTTESVLEYVTLHRTRPVTTTNELNSVQLSSDFIDHLNVNSPQVHNTVPELPTARPRIRIPTTRSPPKPHPPPELTRFSGRFRGRPGEHKRLETTSRGPFRTPSTRNRLRPKPIVQDAVREEITESLTENTLVPLPQEENEKQGSQKHDETFKGEEVSTLTPNVTVKSDVILPKELPKTVVHEELKVKPVLPSFDEALHFFESHGEEKDEHPETVFVSRPENDVVNSTSESTPEESINEVHHPSPEESVVPLPGSQRSELEFPDAEPPLLETVPKPVGDSTGGLSHSFDLLPSRFTTLPPRAVIPTRQRLRPTLVEGGAITVEQKELRPIGPITTAKPQPPTTTRTRLASKPVAPARTVLQSPKRPVNTANSKVLPEYDYIYDYIEEEEKGALGGSLGQLASLTEKAIILPDGTIQCYDTGYFPHPESCKKFISCSKTVRGYLRGWTYTCPQLLVFDPVGGMCNWTEDVDCLTLKK